MASFDKKDFQRFAVSMVGAIALSAACVLAAVGPARGAVPAPHQPTGTEPCVIRLAAK